MRGAGILLLLLLGIANAHAYWLTPTLSPDAPTEQQTISVVMHGGGCDDFFTADPSYPQVTQNGTTIRIIIRTLHQTFAEFCDVPDFIFPIPLGQFGAGSYSVQVDVYYEDLFGFHTDTLGILPVVISPAGSGDPNPVPTGEGLIYLLLSGALVSLAGRKLLLMGCFAAAALAANTASSQSVDISNAPIVSVLLSTAPGAPAAEELVEYGSSPSGQPPLMALRTLRPAAIDFAVTERSEGDAAAFNRQFPRSARAMLERSVLLTFSDLTDAAAVVELLKQDPYVEDASFRLPSKASSASLVHFDVTSALNESVVQGLNTFEAWKVSPGYSLVIAVDTGISKLHPAFRQFSGTTYVGGNFISAASYDVGLGSLPPPAGFDYKDVDEAKAIHNVNNPPLNTCATGDFPPENAGHGTHVAGLIAARLPSGANKIWGACKHCGIAIAKWSINQCRASTATMHLSTNPGRDTDGIATATRRGAQVINMSLGGPDTTNLGFCTNHATDAICVAVKDADDRDIITVAASGNDRARLNVPASTPSVIAVGGTFDNDVSVLWDESPGSSTNCPPTPPNYMPISGHDYECGSNYSVLATLPPQELVAAAKSVRSTTYAGLDWYAPLHCGDSFPGPLGTGIGECTGTSMSTAEVAGIAGLLRSINPLAPKGNPSPASGVRGVLATTTFERIANPSFPWNPQIGYGRPNTEMAARRMLGEVRSTNPRNRVTPLFRSYSTGNTDFVDTTSPQLAVHLNVDEKGSWEPSLSAHAVNGYAFPLITDVPTAAIYVLTTPYRPRPYWPRLKPLYLMSHPAGSDGYVDVDYMLVTSQSEIEAAHALHYDLWNIQGYIFDNCTTNCPPAAAGDVVLRKYNASRKDCAVFLASEQSNSYFSAYSANCPGTSTTTIGWAFKYHDTDSDGLVDGFEYVAGTAPNLVDSDADGSNDAAEYPMVNIPVSDPCSGATGASNCYINDYIFEDGFLEL